MKRIFGNVPILLVVALVMMSATLLIKFITLPPQIPLFYSRPSGNEHIADMYYIFILPILAILIVGTNLLIRRKVFKENDFISSIVKFSNIIAITIITYIFIKIIFLVS